jgi:hypothetical protein
VPPPTLSSFLSLKLDTLGSITWKSNTALGTHTLRGGFIKNMSNDSKKVESVEEARAHVTSASKPNPKKRKRQTAAQKRNEFEGRWYHLDAMLWATTGVGLGDP